MLRLHGYWRSGAAYRVRIALHLKGLEFEQVSHDLRTGEQSSPDYRAVNPQGLVPALETADGIITQSQAIIEWLDERHPSPPLLPGTAGDRATVRAMAAIVACDIHPLNNLRVLQAVEALGADRNAWGQRWLTDGFDAIEPLLARHAGDFAFGDTPTMADCFLVPQVYTAARFGISSEPWPHLARVIASADRHPAFRAAHPSLQPDSDRP